MRFWVSRYLACLILPLALMGATAHPGTPASAVTTPQSAVRLAEGDGMFEFSSWQGPALRLFYHVPRAVTASTPVVFVMHGRGRDADRYRDE